MMTVVYITSYRQNVPQPYLIDCGTLQHILPHPAVQSAISRLSIMVWCTINMFGLSLSLNSACRSVVLCDFKLFVQFCQHTYCLLGLFIYCLFVCFVCATTLACHVHCVNLALWLLYVNKLTYLLTYYLLSVNVVVITIIINRRHCHILINAVECFLKVYPE